MSQDWYYSADGGQKGPVTAADLKKLADAGSLKPTDLIWKDGMTDWSPAKTVKGLFGGGSSEASADAATERKPDSARREPDDDDRPRARRRDEDEGEDDRPSARRRPARDEAEEDDRPRSRRTDDEEDDDRPVRSRRRDDDSDEDLRPKRKKRGGRVPEDTANKKMVAGILGIVLGGLAVHKFYLGYTGTGVLQLILSICTCGLVGWIGLIEGIIYLTKSDEDFHQMYVVEQKQWF